MSAQIVDLRPAPNGWHVATARVDDDTAEIERQTFVLVGWAVVRDSFDELPFVAPCWWELGELSLGEGVDAVEVVPPGGEPDWAQLRTIALVAVRARYHVRADA